MKTIRVEAKKPYLVQIGSHFLLNEDGLQLSLLRDYSFVIVTDHIVKQHWGRALQACLRSSGLSVALLSFPAGEIHKTRQTKMQLEDQLLEHQCGRDTCLIALGGGVVLDLVGFLAATYFRGIPVIYVPTTLLAMVDASVGGKTGVNTDFGKNLIGTISSPYAVYMDVSTLSTLPIEEWRNGIVEMIKHALLNHEAQFERLKTFTCEVTTGLKEFVFESTTVKKNIVESDENEQGIRHLLNLGHTIGHAVEKCEGFSIRHGEAVAIGLLVEGYLSMRLGLLQSSELEKIEDLLRHFKLPLRTMAFQRQSHFLDTLVFDKKSSRKKPRFVLLKKIGEPYRFRDSWLHEVDDTLLIEALAWANLRFGC